MGQTQSVDNSVEQSKPQPKSQLASGPNQTFKFGAATAGVIQVHIQSDCSTRLPELPEYCNPRQDHTWSKDIPAKTGFSIPLDKTAEVDKLLSAKGWSKCQ